MDSLVEIIQESVGDAPPAEELVAEVKEVVNTLVKTLKIFRTYPRENSMVKTAVDNLVSTFSGHLDRCDNLELFVNRHELQWRGITVYSEPDHRRSFAVRLDRDGVRRIVFHKDIAREEIVGLLETLTSDLDDESLNDDIVTLLWDKQLQHVKVYVLNDMNTQARFDPDLVEADAPEDDAPEGEKESDVPGDEEMVLDPRAAAQTLGQTCATTISKLEEPTEEHHKIIKEMTENESQRDASEDLVDVLFDVLLTETDEHVCTNATSALIEVILMCVRNQAFDSATEVIERLRGLAADDSGPLSHDVRAQMIGHLKDLGEEGRVRTLISTLKKHEGIPTADLARFLKTMPVEAVPTLCELLEVNRYLPVMQEVLPHLAQENPELLIEPFSQAEAEAAKRILESLEKVARPETIESLADSLPAKDEAVKTASVKLLEKFHCAASRRVLLSYVAGDSPSLRRAALKALSGFRGGIGEAPELRRELLSADFKQRSLDDKKVLFTTLARLEGRVGVPFLAQTAGRRKWFESRPHQETRACAVFALGEIDDPDARKAIEKRVKDKSETVRAAANVALSRLSDATVNVGS